jgi:hypothetical protein
LLSDKNGHRESPDAEEQRPDLSQREGDTRRAIKAGGSTMSQANHIPFKIVAEKDDAFSHACDMEDPSGASETLPARWIGSRKHSATITAR